MSRQHLRGQAGSSLLLVLGLTAALGVLIPALLTLTGTGLRVTSHVVADRAEVYAATSALEAAIANGWTDESVGTIGGSCADLVVPISGFNVTVKCLTYQPAGDGCRSVDRFATYLAEVRSSGESEVLYRSSSEVAYRFDPNGAPKVEVRQFVSSTSGPVTTQPLSFCSSPSSTTTTSTTAPTTTTTSTTTTTTSTTTTTAPATVMLVKLSTPEREVPPKTSKNRWRAAATATVTDKTGTAVKNAKISVKVRYRTKKDATNSWRDDSALLTGTTDGSGSVRLVSEEYATNGQSVVSIQFVIDSVSRTGFIWTPPAPAVSITVNY